MAARNEGSAQRFKHVFRHCLINCSEIARKKIARPGLLVDDRWATGSGGAPEKWAVQKEEDPGGRRLTAWSGLAQIARGVLCRLRVVLERGPDKVACVWRRQTG